jgi:RNA polymerase sigma-70 factor (ECF subfamily)
MLWRTVAAENLLKGAKTQVDERLLIEAAKRDPRRFADLYEINFDRVYAFVARRVGNREEAQDLTSEVFHQALAGLERFEWRGVPFAAWLYRIATNAITDRWQRLSRERGIPLRGDPPVEDANLDDVGERAAIYRLVRSLPSDQQRVVEMRFAKEMSIHEIAKELGRTDGAVKQLQFRALQNLRGRWGKPMGEANG